MLRLELGLSVKARAIGFMLELYRARFKARVIGLGSKDLLAQ